MMKPLLLTLILSIALFFPGGEVTASDSTVTSSFNLRKIAPDSLPALYNKLSISVNELPMKELLQGIAESSGLNIAISQDLSGKISLSLAEVLVIDLLDYLSRERNIEYLYHRGIIHARNKQLALNSDPNKDLISFTVNGKINVNLHHDSLVRFAKEINEESNLTIIVSDRLSNRIVSAQAREEEPLELIYALSRAWGIETIPLSESIILLEAGPSASNSQANHSKPAEGIACRLIGPDEVELSAIECDPGMLLMTAAGSLSCNLILSPLPAHKVSMNFRRIKFHELLHEMSLSVGLRYSLSQGIFRAGMPGQATEVYRFCSRSVQGVLDAIPSELLKTAEARPFPELNLMIMHGSVSGVSELRNLFIQLDDTVPMVLLEVSIIEYKKGRKVSTGINASFGQQIQEAGGELLPAANLELNTQTINRILSALHGIGWYNLGYLSPDIDLSLSALEEQGMLKVEASPRLSALSGHEASMSIGETEYYVEERNDVIGTQNPQNIQTRQYKSVDADFSLKIVPLVTGDGKIILSVELEQSDFTTRITPDAPPGKVSRRFNSTMCIEDGQTVMLGGLSETSLSETAQGLPILSRIPLLKWLTSSRERDKSKSELVIFIRPIIT
jgi:type IV pilus assembly protein PilQ